MLRESTQVQATIEVALHLSWESKKSSKFFINLLKEGISKATPEQFAPYFELLTSLVHLKDSLHVWRVDTALCSHLQIIESNVAKKDATDKYVKYLVKLANENEEVKVWLFKHKEMLNKVLGEAGYKVL